MLEITLKIDEIDYNSLIKNLLPLLIDNKLKLKALQISATTLLLGLNGEQKDKKIAAVINQNNFKLQNIINNKLHENNAQATITSITAK
jgi:hypothetical protein